jgi:hypothetical protein
MVVYVSTAIAILGYLVLCLRKPHNEIAKAIQKEAKELLLFISLIGATFTLIQIAIDLMPVTPDDSLLSLERKIVWLRHVTDWITMPAWAQVLSFMSLLFFAFLSVRMARLKAIGRLSAANNYIAKAHLILTLASAVTFFGTGTGSGAAHKEARLVDQLEATNRGYKDAANAVEKDAIRTAVFEITNSWTRPEIGSFVTAVDTSRGTAKQIKDTDSRLPSVEDYARSRGDYVGAPGSYELAADLLEIQYGLASLAAPIAGDDRAPSSASLAINAEVNQITNGSRDSVASSEFKTAIAESVDAAYDFSTDSAISAIATYASKHNLPAQVLEVVLKKAVSDGFKEFLKDKVAGTLTAIYEKHRSPKETIFAMRETVRDWVSAQNRNDLSQLDQNLASSAKEEVQSAERESADVSRIALDFADARSRQLVASSNELVSKVILSDSTDIETIWTNVKDATPSSQANYFERLGSSEEQYAIAVKLKEAGDSTADDSGAVKAAAAIEYEALCCGTQRLSDAYAIEADRILAREKRSYWGRIRAIAEVSVAENTMNYDSLNLAAAKRAIFDWRSYSAKLSVSRARAGQSAGTIPEGQWDEWFAAYLTKHADMAALWGFVVISTTDDDGVWEPYYQERIQAAAYKTKKKPIDMTEGGKIDFSQFFDKNDKNNETATLASEAQIRAHGPYPKDGYRYFMSKMHAQPDADAAGYFSSPEATKYIDKFCPRTQLSH